MAHNLTTTLTQIRAKTNQRLDNILVQQIKRAGTIDPLYRQLQTDLRKYIMRGGKRLRPVLAVLAYRSCGQNDDAIYDMAVVLELLHAFLLVHDDLIDHDERRYGGLNIIGQYSKRLAKSVHPVVAHELADATALIAGDILHSLAYEQLARIAVEPTILLKLQSQLATMIFEIAAGQQLDIMMIARKNPSLKDILKVSHYKTAGYSVVTPLQIGGIMAGADSKTLAAFADFGYSLGIAFQLMDDLLGMFGSTRVTGKPVLSDLQEGKRTVLMHYGFKFANPTQKSILQKKLGNKQVTVDDLREVKHILIDSGARNKTIVLASEYAAKAITVLADVPINSEYKALLIDLANYCIDRKA